MARAPKHRPLPPPHELRPSTVDLFGDVPVTHDDINAWLRQVPRIEPGSRRAAHYVQGYDVIGKIKRAKLEGTFEARTAPYVPRQADAWWWERFDWSKPRY
jgi:hypothetical protein